MFTTKNLKKLFIIGLLTLVSHSLRAQFPIQRNTTNDIAYLEAKQQHNKILLGQSKIGGNYDLKYHRLIWRVNPANNYISGNVTSYFKAVGSMSSMQFELNQSMNVDSVKYHSNHISFTHSSGLITITFPMVIAANQLDSVTVYYKGSPSQGGGFGSFITDTHNGTPVLWTLSEPFGAPDWWPCKNSLSDKIDSIDIHITTPQQYKAASNGMLKSSVNQGGNFTYKWKHKYPIATYLIAIAVTNYAVYTDTASLSAGKLPIVNYVYPEDLVTAQQSTPDLIPVMQLYDSLFSNYPFMNEKYGHAQFGWGGGMEHQTMTFLVNYGYDLMAHELAHMWFGNKITCKNWHEIWINEGFATYLTGLTYDFFNTHSSWIGWKQDCIANITSEPGGSVYCDDTTNVWRIFSGRLSYDKGAMVLNMLRWKIGDSAFFSCMKNFITDPALAYKFAGTEDFKAHAEASSGSNLTDFFNDWIYNQGFPTYTLNTHVFQDSVVSINVQQQQSHSSVSYFKLPLPLKFSNASKDTLIVLNNTSNNQNFSFPLNFMPTSVTFDPESDLIALVNSNIVTFSVENYNNNLINIYPNPVTNRINIDCRNLFVESIEIFNSAGQICFTLKHNNYIDKTDIDLSGLKQGAYLIKINSPENILVKNFVKL